MSSPFYSRYNPPRVAGIDFDPETGLTKQEFKREADINVMMNRYLQSGVQLSGNPRDPMYGDFTEVTDFQTSLETIKRAEEQFAGLSSKVRDRFHNDPAEFLGFVSDPKNVEEAFDLGMLNDAAYARIKAKRDAIITPPPGGVVVETLKTS